MNPASTPRNLQRRCPIHVPTRYSESAVFGALTWHATERFDLQIGARQSENRQRYTYVNTGPFVPIFYGAPSPLVAPISRSKDDSFTYLVTPRLKLSPDLMLYARFASGYRPGGPNPGIGVPPEFKPDTTENYEIGLKGNFLANALSVDASLYYIDWQDIQISLVDPNSHTSYTGNAGEAKSQGLELSVQARPAEGLLISSWITLGEAVLTEDFPATSEVYGRSGDRLPSGSRFSSHLSLDKEFPLTGNMQGFVGGSVSYVGSRVGKFRGVPQRQVFPAYANGDVRAGVRYDSWEASLFVNNVADKRAVLSGGLGTDVPHAFTYIQPRTIGMSLRKSF